MTARFVTQENVKHYRRLLETVTDKAEQQKILRLLAEEQEKQRAAGDPIIEDAEPTPSPSAIECDPITQSPLASSLRQHFLD